MPHPSSSPHPAGLWAAAILLGLSLVGGTAFARDPAPQVTVSGNGYGRVDIGADCVVPYGLDGRRQYNPRNCSRDELAQADRAMAAYRREHGLGGRPGGGFGQADNAPPRVSMSSSGFGQVDIGNRCVVPYGRDGRRETSPGNCTRDELARADRAMAAYRREQGLAQGGQRPPPTSSSSGRPEVQLHARGGEVSFGSRCRVFYDKDGRRDRTAGVCSSDQLREADKQFTLRRTQKQLIDLQGEGS